MAIKSHDDLLNSIKGLLADDTSDASLSLLEDVSDTLKSIGSDMDKANEWKQKYEENDKMWREKYRDRFFNTGSEDVKNLTEPDPQPKDPEPQIKTFEDLFKEG